MTHVFCRTPNIHAKMPDYIKSLILIQDFQDVLNQSKKHDLFYLKEFIEGLPKGYISHYLSDTILSLEYFMDKLRNISLYYSNDKQINEYLAAWIIIVRNDNNAAVKKTKMVCDSEKI